MYTSSLSVFESYDCTFFIISHLLCVLNLYLYIIIKKSGLVGPGEEDELQETATKIEDETGVARNTVIKNIDKTH